MPAAGGCATALCSGDGMAENRALATASDQAMAAIGLVILDRDGVINEDSPDFIRSPEAWRPIPGSLEAIGQLTRAGWCVAVATNQSGIARGLFDEATLGAIHLRMLAAVEAVGGRIEVIAYCPHGPHDGCSCRKPEPGLLYQIAVRTGRSIVTAPCVGDSLRDLIAAQTAGCRPVLVRTGKGRETEAGLEDASIAVFDDLQMFVRDLTGSRS